MAKKLEVSDIDSQLEKLELLKKNLIETKRKIQIKDYQHLVGKCFKYSDSYYFKITQITSVSMDEEVEFNCISIQNGTTDFKIDKDGYDAVYYSIFDKLKEITFDEFKDLAKQGFSEAYKLL